MKNTLKLLNQRPIAYFPIYRTLTGSTTAGIMLSQLMYWFSSIKNDEIFKTDNEIMDETLLTEKELRNAKNAIKKLTFLEVFIKGVPAKTYYKIDWDEYENVLNNSSPKGGTSSDQRAEPVLPKGRNCDSQKGETIIVKSFDRDYTETTTESIKNKQKELSSSLQTKIQEKLSEYQNINLEAFYEWVNRKKYKDIAPITKLLNMLTKYDYATQQQMIDTSVMNNYAGVFEPKTQRMAQPYNTPKSQTLNTDVNIWDELEKQNNREKQGKING